jgi:hypothetical protein
MDIFNNHVGANKDLSIIIPGTVSKNLGAVGPPEVVATGIGGNPAIISTFRDMIFADREADQYDNQSQPRTPGSKRNSAPNVARIAPGFGPLAQMFGAGGSGTPGRVGSSPVVLRSPDTPLCTDAEGRVVFARSSPAPPGPGKPYSLVMCVCVSMCVCMYVCMRV